MSDLDSRGHPVWSARVSPTGLKSDWPGVGSAVALLEQRQHAFRSSVGAARDFYR